MGMDGRPSLHPWVAERRDRITFGLQLSASRGPQDPGPALVAAARVADGLGFDAVYLGDHPA
jgi:alkanesulfonate monooxygenase SsuD/methylene tetrahydromethanopterin reductase-like flavin-dependent oxidoreductase (luciferase family)